MARVLPGPEARPGAGLGTRLGTGVDGGEEVVILTTVMLVEDNESVRDALALVVEREPGLRLVAAAPDAESGVPIALHLRPRVVVMDVQLPGRDGVAATRDLCLELPDVRVVILSASGSRQVARRAFAAGACGYLVKGGSPDGVVDAIRRAADSTGPVTASVWRLPWR